jgi:hypothetical protein
MSIELPVYRAPMRSRDDAVPRGVGAERALALGICGIGGRVSPPPTTLDAALALADEQSGIRLAWKIERFARAPIGAYAWTRDIDGLSYLGRLAGPWAYDASVEALAADLVHVRACDWILEPVPDDLVPGAVQAAFGRGGRNWQRIRAEGVTPPTAAVWQRYRDEN